MPNRFVEGLTIRAVLIAGFSLMLGLWLFAGYQVTLRLQAAQRESVAANAHYIQAQELLASVRAQVLVASVQVRDALLDTRASSLESNRQAIQRAYDLIDRQLAAYVPFVGSPAERERIARLRDEIREFRFASDEVLATDRRRWPTEAGLLLRRFMPRREAAIRVSEEIQSLNRAAFIDQQRTVSAMEASLHRQVWAVFGAALAISLGIGWLALQHSTRLERRLTEQRGREERIATDLQRLSARLLHAQEEEQRRIARELHDEVGQALSAVQVELTVAHRRLERVGAEADLLADARASADAALRGVRDLSHLLHPSALDDLGLVAALESQLADFGRRHGVAIDFSHRGMDGRQSDATERAIYRIVQEALTNIARHAHARRIRVALEAEGGRCRATVEDDGVGFDVDDAERPGRRRGLGLLGIRERVAQLHGAVAIESSPSGGARIHVELPAFGLASASARTFSDAEISSPALVSDPEVDHG